MIENELLSDFVKMSKMIEEKDQHIKELENQLTIYKRALELACEDISLYEDITTPEFKAKCYLDQAKKELEEQDVKD